MGSGWTLVIDRPRLTCFVGFFFFNQHFLTGGGVSQLALVVKNLPVNAADAGDLGSIPRLGRSPGGGNDNPLQYSCLEKSHGQRILAGYSPWGHEESDTVEHLLLFCFFKLVGDSSDWIIISSFSLKLEELERFLQVLKFSEFSFPPKLEIVIPTWEGCWDDHVGTCTEKVHANGLFQFSSVAQSCLTLCDHMNLSTPGLPVHHQLPEFTQTHVHWIGDVIQPSHPLSSPSPPAPNPSQHQGLFQWVSSSHQVAQVLEFQLQHQSFQWTPRTDLL